MLIKSIFFTQLTKIPLRLLFCLSLVCVIFTESAANATLTAGPGRVRQCDATGNPEPLSKITIVPDPSGDDVLFDLVNPVCLTIATTTYAAVKTSIAAMNYNCGTGSSVPRVTPSPLLDVRDYFNALRRAVDGGACFAASTTALTALGTAFYESSIVYGIAQNISQNTQLCGANWMGPNPRTYDFSTPVYRRTIDLAISKMQRDNPEKLNLDSGSKEFREFYYGGVEVEDVPDNEAETCYDPTVRMQNGEYPKQKYYMRGSEAGNFNCEKYMVINGQNDPITRTAFTTQRLEEMRSAYTCCKKRSQEYVCLDYGFSFGELGTTSSRRFCKAGHNCTIRGVAFRAGFRDNNRLICAESYSLCPYNFAVGLGSEYCDYYQDGIFDAETGNWRMITQAQVEAGACTSNSEIRNQDCTYNDKAGRCKNYCQYLKHCVRTGAPAEYQSKLGSPYFSEACVNFTGDSRNKTSFGGNLFGGHQKHFSAPIAQCVKETIENLFYNRAGHTQCLTYNEMPSSDGTCPSGSYDTTNGTLLYKKGGQVYTKSFFTTIQDLLQGAVRVALMLSVMFYGMNLLIGKSDIREKKDILVYLLKIGIVLYFATGDAWQKTFFEGVYGASSELARLVFKIEGSASPEKRDGCQFLDITLSDGTSIPSGVTYPSGKRYLALWDTLDCKLMLYLGFGPGASVSNLVMFALAAFFTGPIGVYVSMSVMFFGFFFIAAAIRALHIFLSSCLAIVIFVFVSPIIIPTVLFAKTKDIFDKWLKELISFCFQPMILFAYIAIFVTVLDKTVVGSATFKGTPPHKTVACDTICKNSDGSIAPYVNGTPPSCILKGQREINPINDSVICLVGFNNFGKFPGFEMIGIGLPFLFDLFNSNAKEKILILLRAALVMYLLYKFMDDIPDITKDLIGGTPLPGMNKNVMDMLSSAVDSVSGAATRISRAGKGGATKAVNRAQDYLRDRGEKGKSEGQPQSSGSNKTSSGGSGNDTSRSSAGGNKTSGSGDSA